ncbi:MAG: hypothetical protein ACREEK_14960 [Bradyrhizobium sp.]
MLAANEPIFCLSRDRLDAPLIGRCEDLSARRAGRSVHHIARYSVLPGRGTLASVRLAFRCIHLIVVMLTAFFCNSADGRSSRLVSSRSIDADRCRNRADSESAKFAFEIKSANF